MRYVADEIGEEYKDWESNDIILITAATGTGKSHFILHELLKRVIDEDEKLLYLVNRKILKRQLEYEIENNVNDEMRDIYKEVFSSADHYIKIMTYQSIEESLKGKDCNALIHKLSGYKYVVYDECHYFYCDSNYNTSTELSYDCLRTVFNGKIQILMSATMERIEEVLRKRPNGIYYPFAVPNKIFREANIAFLNKNWMKGGDRIRKYSIPADYSYVKCVVFEDIEQLKDIIIEKGKENKKEKWLIFTDSIAKGHELEAMLISGNKKKVDGCIQKEDVVFIDAKYPNNPDKEEYVKKIEEDKVLSKPILIATAVLDNGVTIKENELRNIVILADTKESFIQMLGRKRVDGEIVTLYICRRNEKHFKRRLMSLNDAVNFMNTYTEDLNHLFGQQQNFHIEYPFIRLYTNKFQIPLHYQQRAMDGILNNDRVYSGAKKICYSFWGVLRISDFSIMRINCLRSFYRETIEALKENPNAFAIIQMKWLGFDDAKINETLKISDMNCDDEYRNLIDVEIKKRIEEFPNGFDKEENRNLKRAVSKYLLYFMRRYSSENDNLIEYLTQDDKMHLFSINNFSVYMQAADLPYCMVKNGGSLFIIKEKVCEGANDIEL